MVVVLLIILKLKYALKCNHLVLEELLDTITYAKCTHSY